MIPTCSFGRDELSAVLKHQHDKHGMNTGLMCIRCNKVFSQSGKLKDHLLTCKNKERPFICEQCGQDFRQRTELNIHLKQVHPKVPGDRSGFLKCPSVQKSSAHIQADENMSRSAQNDYIQIDCGELLNCIAGCIVGFVLQYIHYWYSAPTECLGPAQ